MLPIKSTDTNISRFANVEQAPPIETFEPARLFFADTFPKKVNLWVGAYRDHECQPWVLPVVRAVERNLAVDENLNKEYLPILGLETFTTAATKLILAADSPAIKEKRAFGVQCLSGSGALRLGADFLAKILGFQVFYCSKPTWENHKRLFLDAHFEILREYRYWSEKTKNLDFDSCLKDLNNAPENSVIVLHACAHNPTGCDPTQQQWKKIADIMEKRKLFPFFDSAFQGLATGDLEKDAWAVRYFVERGFELLCAQSFAKNFGLYNERVGNLIFVVKNFDFVDRIKSQVSLLIRGMYSNSPSHGARIVGRVLNDLELYNEWKICLNTMLSRIMDMRKALREALEELQTPGDWSLITNQIGMFLFTGFSEKEIKHLAQNYHIYMQYSGRMSLCGLTSDNVKYVAKAIYETVTYYAK